MHDRNRDSDDDDYQDRDYDVAALANNLSQAFRYGLYNNDDLDEVTLRNLLIPDVIFCSFFYFYFLFSYTYLRMVVILLLFIHLVDKLTVNFLFYFQAQGSLERDDEVLYILQICNLCHEYKISL